MAKFDRSPPASLRQDPTILSQCNLPNKAHFNEKEKSFHRTFWNGKNPINNLMNVANIFTIFSTDTLKKTLNLHIIFTIKWDSCSTITTIWFYIASTILQFWIIFKQWKMYVKKKIVSTFKTISTIYNCSSSFWIPKYFGQSFIIFRMFGGFNNSFIHAIYNCSSSFWIPKRFE